MTFSPMQGQLAYKEKGQIFGPIPKRTHTCIADNCCFKVDVLIMLRTVPGDLGFIFSTTTR